MKKREHVCLDLAGLGIDIRCSDRSFLSLVRDRCPDFLLQNGDCGVHVAIRLHRKLTVLDEGPWGQEFRIETVWKNGTVSVLSYHFRGEFDFHGKAGWLETDVGDSLGSLDNYLRVVGAGLLARENGLLLHAAGVSRGGLGFLFPGPSGAGKTTIASLSEEGQVLGDDLIAVREGHASPPIFAIHSIPMQGERRFARRNERLTGIFFPVKDTKNFLGRISRSEAAAHLLGSLPFLCEKDRRLPGLLDLCDRLVTSVPAYRLHFTKDGTFWGVLGNDCGPC